MFSIYKNGCCSSWISNAFVLCLFVLIAVFSMSANPFRNETVAPFDLLDSYPGWSSVSSDQHIVHHERSDALVGYFPIWFEIKNLIRRGEVPVWLHKRSGGIPGIQNLAWGTLTPSYLIFLITDNDGLGIYLSGLVKLVIAGFGMFLFLRIYFNNIPSVFGGIAFMLAGFNAAWFYWPHVSTSGLIPWLLWATSKYLHEEKSGYLIVITLSSIMMIIGGFPSVAVYGYICFSILIAIYNLSYYTDMNRFVKKTFWPFLSVAVSFLVSIYFLAVLAEYLSQFDLSGRQGGTIFRLKDFKLFFDPYYPKVEKSLYVGLLPMALSTLSIIAFCRNKLSRHQAIIVKYFFVIGIVSTIITFGLVHHNIIRSIPTFGSNPWQRMNIIISFSLSALGASGLSYLLHFLKKRKMRYHNIIYIICILCMFVFQILDQKKLFNSFNAVVDSKLIYPHTPSLDYIQKNIGGLQSVIADNSFMISGSLTAYGIAEWFAQNLKTDQQKELMERMVLKPFVNPFAATFDASRINIGSKYMDLFGIKYLIFKKDRKNILKEQTGDGHQAALPLPNHKWRQYVWLPKKTYISGISLLLATYSAPEAPSDVTILWYLNSEITSKSVVSKEDIKDNKWVDFIFKNPFEVDAGFNSFDVRLSDKIIDDQLTAWCTINPDPKQDYLLIDGIDSKSSLKFKLHDSENNKFISKYKVHSFEDGISILENSEVHDGPVFLESLKGGLSGLEVKDIHLTKVSADKISLSYVTSKPGYIILPIRYYPGWMVNKNGIYSKPEIFLGTFPAIPVDNDGAFNYEYRSSHLKRYFLISFLGILVYGILGIMSVTPRFKALFV